MFFVCLGAALAGTYSLASGILIWPILLLEAIALRLSRRLMLGIASFGFVVYVLRALEVSGEERGFMASAYAHPAEVFHFFLALFGTSWSATSQIPGSAVTVIAILTAAALLLRALIAPSEKDYLRIALLCICALTVGNAAMTAVVRWQLGIGGRYETPIFLFWCALGLLALSYLESRGGNRGLIVFEIALVLGLAFGGSNLPKLTSQAKAMGQGYRVAQAAMGARVPSYDALSILGMRREWTFGELDFLARQKASLYSTQPTSLLGTPLLQHFTLSAGDCAGEVGQPAWVAENVSAGMVFPGWLPSKHSDGPLKWILVTDAQKKIVGFGSASQLAQAPGHLRRHGPGGIYWDAFAPSTAAQGNLFLYRVLRDNSVCAINAPQPIPPIGGPANFDANEAKDLLKIWTPEAPGTKVIGGTAAVARGVLLVKSSTTDTQVYLNSTVDLRQFETLVLKAKFERQDTVEIFFGQQLNGRGIAGVVPIAGQWIYVFVQVGNNSYWKQEAAGEAFRFDPTGGLGVGSSTKIAAVWGSRKAIADGPDSFEFAVAREGSR